MERNNSRSILFRLFTDRCSYKCQAPLRLVLAPLLGSARRFDGTSAASLADIDLANVLLADVFVADSFRADP